MAIVKVSKDIQHTDSVDVHYDPATNRITATLAEVWNVVTNSKTMSPVDILGATDGTNTAPVAGSPYVRGVAGNQFICDQTNVTRTGPLSWDIAAHFYFVTLPDSTLKLCLGSVAYPQNAFKDKDGNPVVNSAGQTFDPSLTKTYYDLKFTLSYQSKTTPPISTILGTRGKVNSDSCSISAGGWSQTFAARTLKIDDADCDFEYHGSAFIWSVSISFVVRIDTYVDHLLDQGYATLDSDGNLVAIKDANGDPLNSPAQLDGSGNLLASGADPVFLDFPIEEETAMTSIIAAMV